MSSVTADPLARTSLYRFFASDGELLYVGVSCSLPGRLRSHGRSRPWWSSVSRIDVEHYDSRPRAIDAEREAVARERPRFNIQHHPEKPRKKISIKKFYRINGVPSVHAHELRIAAVMEDISRAQVFERLALAISLEDLVTRGVDVHNPEGETLTMAIDARVKEAIDGAAAKTGIPIQSAGRMILAALAGRMVETVRESAA